MKKVCIMALHKTIREKWIPLYNGVYRSDCALCEILGCDNCPVRKKYSGCYDKKFGFFDWLCRSGWRKHSPEALKVLQNLIRLLPVKERYKTEIKYLKIKEDSCEERKSILQRV